MSYEYTKVKLYLSYILCSCIVLTGEHKLACLVVLAIVREDIKSFTTRGTF